MKPVPSREEILFHACLEMSREQWQAFLRVQCAGEPEVRRAVEELLATHDSADPRLETGCMAVPAGTEIGAASRASPTTTGIGVGDWIGRYRLLELLGEGGCGRVYMAEQREPIQRRVALKVLKPGMDSRSVVVRFEAERQALALMDHPHIARVLDGGTAPSGQPYFVMELVRGLPMTEFCDREKLSTRQRLDLFLQVCAAVQHAHQKGIVHRDLKPSNVLVSVMDGKACPKVIDFGIAKAMQGRLTDQTLFTAFHQFMGTPAYMSPEQAGMDGVDVDTRSDVYSLGVLLYELLAGSPPFSSKDLLESGFDAMRRRIREEEPPPPSRRLSTLAVDRRDSMASLRATPAPRLIQLVKGDLDWIVMKCLEKDRERRYSTANDLASDISRHLVMEPVTARPQSLGYILWRQWRRHRWAFGAGALVLVTLISATAVSLLLARRAERARQEASLALQRLERQNLRSAELFQMSSHEWRSVAYGLSRHVSSDVLSNAASDLEARFSDASESSTRRLLWKVYGSFLRSWSGDRVRATQQLREATEELERVSGVGASDTLFARMCLADIQLARGLRAPEIESLLWTNLREGKAATPPDWRVIAYACRGLADHAVARQDAASTLKFCREGVEAVTQAFGFQNYDRSYQLGMISEVLRDAGLTNEAVGILRDRFQEEAGFGHRLNGVPNPMTRVWLAHHLVRSQRYEEAESLLTQGIEQRHDLPTFQIAELHHERSEIRLRTRREPEALEDALLASRRERPSLAHWRVGTLLLLRAGRRSEYESECRRGLDLHSYFVSASKWEQVAATVALGSEDPGLLDQAENLLRKAVGTLGESGNPTLALLRYRQGRVEEAAAILGKVAWGNHRDVPQVAARFTLALTEARRRKSEEARKAYEQGREALRLAQSSPSRYSVRNWLEVEILETEAGRKVADLSETAPGTTP